MTTATDDGVGLASAMLMVMAAGTQQHNNTHLYWFLIDCPDTVSTCASTIATRVRTSHTAHTQVYSSLKCNHLNYKKREGTLISH